VDRANCIGREYVDASKEHEQDQDYGKEGAGKEARRKEESICRIEGEARDTDEARSAQEERLETKAGRHEGCALAAQASRDGSIETSSQAGDD